MDRGTIDRLGLAWCRLNCYEWDPFLGDEPPGYAQMSNDEKHTVIRPMMLGIESIIGEANISRCWWKYQITESEEEWLTWYIHHRFERIPGDHYDDDAPPKADVRLFFLVFGVSLVAVLLSVIALCILTR